MSDIQEKKTHYVDGIFGQQLCPPKTCMVQHNIIAKYYQLLKHSAQMKPIENINVEA